MAQVVTTKSQVRTVKGGWLEYVQVTGVDPVSIAAGAQGTVVVTVVGAKVGDLVFVSPEGLDTQLASAGAKVTGADTVTLYLNNVIDATTAIDGAAKTWNLIIVHLT